MPQEVSMQTKKIRKIPLLTLLAIIFSFACILLPIEGAFAQTAHPALTCTTTCYSEYWWNGNTYGGSVNFTISNPGLNRSPSFFYRMLRLQPNDPAYSNDPYPRLDIGIAESKGGGYGGYCGTYHGGALSFFYYALDFTGQVIDTLCQEVPSADYNSTVTVSAIASDCAGELDGLVDEMFISISSPHFFQSYCLDTETAYYTRETLYEQISDNFTDHHVWGSAWTLASYVNSNYNFVYQSRGEDGYILGDPPQMYWYTTPAPGNHGGILYSCDYAYGNTCTYGS
jgi:hypothetical protein